MKQAKVELIEKTDKTYTYQNIVFRKYNIKLSSLANVVMYSFPDDKDLTFKKDDTISFEYNQEDNKISKIKKIEKPMYNNYNKEKPEYSVRLDTGRSILLQVAFKEASQAFITGKITQEEVEQLTNKYFKIIDK